MITKMTGLKLMTSLMAMTLICLPLTSSRAAYGPIITFAVNPFRGPATRAGVLAVLCAELQRLIDEAPGSAAAQFAGMDPETLRAEVIYFYQRYHRRFCQ